MQSSVEARFLLYAVALGAALGLYVLLHRRARAFWFHAFLLGILLAATVWALGDDGRTVVLSVPLFLAFAVFSLLPSLFLMGARRAVPERRYRLAAWMAHSASALLGFPGPTRGEASFYSAIDDADRGHRARATERLEALARRGMLPGAHGGATLARVLPAAADRDWPAVLAAVEELPSTAPAVQSLESRAAAETGDLSRALRTCRSVEAHSGVATLHAQTRRAVLACAGRTDVLDEADHMDWPLMAGSAGAGLLARARAREAAGEADLASRLYERAERETLRAQRREAVAGRTRIAAGSSRLGAPTADEMEELRALEARCRDEARLTPKSTSSRVIAVPLLSLIAFIVSVGTFLFVGDDGNPFSAGAFELLLGGALSAPLIIEQGQWWRLLSTMDLHGGWVHLGMNLGSILLIGWPLERRIGWARTVIVYLGSGVMGSLASVYVNHTDVGVGASGAAMGLIGALLVILLLRAKSFPRAQRSRWLFVLWLCIAATAAIGIVEHRFIDNAAHGVGLVAGALLALALLPRPTGAVVTTGLRVGALLLLALLGWSEVSAYLEGRRWQEPLVVAEQGVTAELPGFLHVRRHELGGLIADGRPWEIRIYLGAEPRAEPNALRLLPAGSGLRRVFLRHRANVRVGTSPVVVRPEDDRDREDLGEDYPDGLRILRVSNGAAFALVLLPEGPAAEAYRDVVQQIRASVAPMR